jgi:hypothetical protein
MKQNPLATPGDVNARVGPLRRLARWAVPRWGVVTFLLMLLVVGGWVAAWWLGFKGGTRGGGVSTSLVTFPFFDTAGRVCLAGACLWLLLLGAFCTKGQPFFAGTRSWHFGVRHRQRIREGRPIEPGLLRAYGAFALAGFALGLVLALKLAVASGWRDPAFTQGLQAMNQGILPLAVLYLSGRLIRNVLSLRDFDYFVGDKARESAEAMIEEEDQETEADREYERKTIRGLPYVIFMGGFVGGLFLSMRLLSERDKTVAFQASISGLILSVAGLYLLKTRPRRWWLWLALAILVALGFLIFTQVSWDGSPLALLVGVLWGALVGTASTLLYLRQLKAGAR